MVTSCEAGMPLTATPLNKKLWSLPTPNRPLFANSRKGQQWRESQPTPTPLHARRRLKGDLCERREEFNEVRGEYRSATTSANAYVNASLKSLLGTRYQLGGPWATKIIRAVNTLVLVVLVLHFLQSRDMNPMRKDLGELWHECYRGT